MHGNKNAPLKIILLNCTLGHCVKPPIYDGICFHLKKKLVEISICPFKQKETFLKIKMDHICEK